MQLTLKYKEHATHVLSGAFIRGNTPGIWLQEINAWQLPLNKLVCFIIAENNNPANAAGLFVVFSKDQMPGMLQVKHPYTVLGKKLFIPVNAELSPAISEQELQSLLIWDYQVFHPTIGFIGFERSDRINLADLLQYQEPRNVYWGYARPGHQPWIPLRQINVEQLTAEQVFDSFKEHISNKPLDEIPKSNKKEVPAWLNNPVASTLFKKSFSFLSKLSSLIPKGSSESSGSPGSAAGSEGGYSGPSTGREKKPGLFSKLVNWMQEKIEDLEKQRESELKRLSDMFEKDSDEALQYAIPLSSPYEGRGTAQPSASLTKHSTQFNLGGLGGGQAADGWNVDNYYNDLRAKYLKAAQKAIEEKDFKKAAYVYAHLLGDLSSAAATLRQGKHYRQAAALYKEHLNNLAMAATCYEEGGLLLEAIDMYTQLGKHEKAGDLYKELGRQEQALHCYEKCVAAAAQHKDYLEQSRIIIDKIEDTPRAKQVLLNGWHDVKQPEACLLKYFNLAADDNKGEIHSLIKTFYANNQAANKEMAFLNVIDKVNQKYKTTELENACEGIAYEIVSEQVKAGNPESLFALRNFVPNDQLLTPDFYRFMHTVKDAPKQKPAPGQWQLMSEAHWKKVLVWQNQLLIWGLRSSGLELARMNWDGYVEYFSWSVLKKTGGSLLPIANPPHTNHILVYDYNPAFTNKHLPKEKHFQDALHVFRPDFIDASTIGIGFYKNLIVVLQQSHGEGSLIYYSLEGKVITYSPCTFNNSANNFGLTPAPVQELMWCSDRFYLNTGHLLLTISEKGAIDVLFNADTPIWAMAINQRFDGLTNIVMALDERVVIITSNAWNELSCEPVEIKELKVRSMAFLTNDRIALAAKGEVRVIDLKQYASPELEWSVKTEYLAVAVFPGPNRDQLGILESNGKITLHNIP
jgi:tetratricopeptide (TPR) repeat protein